MHGTDRPLAAVKTRHGPQCNYSRYPAFVSQPSQSSSPFNTHAPACHDAQTAFHYTHTHPGRRGCMLTHGGRHLPHTHSDLTHAVFLTLGRSLTHRASLTHTIAFTHAGALTRGVSFIRGVRTRVPLHSHTRDHSLTRGASSIHGVLGSTHSGTLVTTPLTHVVSATHGISSTHGVSFAHGVALTHALALPLCVRCSTHFATLVNTHTGTFTMGNRVTSNAPWASIPPKLLVHPSTAHAPSTPLGTTELTWS